MSFLLAVTMLACGADAASTEGLVLPLFKTNVETHRVFGQEHPGPYKHPASITQLANGDLYIAYYGGENEYDDNTAVYGSRCSFAEEVGGEVREDAAGNPVPIRPPARRHGAPDREWSPPVVIADTPFQGDGNPVVWQAPDGLVWLFYVNRLGETWCTSRVKAKVSKDGAETWSDSFMLTWEEGTMVRGQPIVLNNGDYLLPLYKEMGGDREFTSPETSCFFLRYTPSTKTWTESSRIHSAKGNEQAQVVQLTDDHLFCFTRRSGGYEPTTDGWMIRSDSFDGGKTWSEGVNTDIPNCNAAVELIKLANGDLLLVYNDNMNDRTPLTVAVSKDGGETWPFKRNIAGGNNDFAYPYAVQGKDGKIYLVYTTNGRTTIMLAVFDEAAVTEYTNE